MNIRIHIERVVLEGLPVTAAQSALVRDTLQRELAAALSRDGLAHELRRGGAFPSMRASDSKLRQSNPGEMGKQIARSIHGTIGRSK